MTDLPRDVDPDALVVACVHCGATVAARRLAQDVLDFGGAA